MEKREIVIVGGGVAGLSLAKFLSESKVDFVLLEDHKKFFQKACGECVSTNAFGNNFFDFYSSRRGIENEITSFAIYLPYNYEIRGEVNYLMLNKERFEAELARQARKNGEIRMGERVERIKKLDDGILVEPQGIKAKCIVGADGAFSIVRRSFTNWNPELGFAIEGMKEKKEEDHEIKFYFGKKYVEGGYAWKFPKRNTYNIGIGSFYPPKKVMGMWDRLRKEWDVKKFRGSYLPYSLPNKTYFDRCILIGDAASQVDPLTGGGINLSITCAMLASKVLEKIYKGRKDYSEKNLEEYERLWREKVGEHLYFSYKWAKIIYTFLEKNDLLFYLVAKIYSKKFFEKLRKGAK